MLDALLRAAIASAAVIFALSGAQAEERYLFGNFGEIGKNADKFEFRLGALSYDTGLFTSKEYDGLVINGELVFPSPDLLYSIGSPRPYIGFDVAAVSNPVHFAYAGLTWDTYLTERLYVSGSFGGAVTTADNLEDRSDGYKALGCRVLFHGAVGFGFDITPNATVQLYADHFSNGGICRPNNGAEAAGIRFGYRF